MSSSYHILKTKDCKKCEEKNMHSLYCAMRLLETHLAYFKQTLLDFLRVVKVYLLQSHLKFRHLISDTSSCAEERKQNNDRRGMNKV